MAVEHTLLDMDTLSTLALAYLGDATRWKEIADYNKLSYPYILQTRDDLNAFFGSGYVTVVRANTQADVTIKKGWQFKTKPNSVTGGVAKVFLVIEDTYIPAGISVAYVPLRATVAGSFGNVVEYTIVDAGDNTVQSSGIQFTAIYNEFKFTGGQDINVRVTGDTIFIPADSSEVIPEDVSKILELIGGSDLVLDINGDLMLNDNGDLASVSGAENIENAVVSRIMTELGEFSLHPDYGTEVEMLIGSPYTANREKLIEVGLIRALNQEDRITAPAINSLSVLGTSIYLNITYKLAVNGTAVNLQLVR